MPKVKKTKATKIVRKSNSRVELDNEKILLLAVLVILLIVVWMGMKAFY